jgi:hypothetical protein
VKWLGRKADRSLSEVKKAGAIPPQGRLPLQWAVVAVTFLLLETETRYSDFCEDQASRILYSVFQKKIYNFESLYKFIQTTCAVLATVIM